jgi:hypothetical protein
MQRFLGGKNIEAHATDDGTALFTYGLHLRQDGGGVEVEVSAFTAKFAFEALDAALLSPGEEQDIKITIWFSDGLAIDTFFGDSTAKLYGSEIKLGESGTFTYRDAKFAISTNRYHGGAESLLNWEHRGRFQDERLPKVISLLRKLGILFETEQVRF